MRRLCITTEVTHGPLRPASFMIVFDVCNSSNGVGFEIAQYYQTVDHFNALDKRFVRASQNNVACEQKLGVRAWENMSACFFLGLNTVDFFFPLLRSRYNQRYFVNDAFWDKTNGPVFILIEGEGESPPCELQLGWES